MKYRFLHATPAAPIPPRTLGIEVVSPELAAQCDLGNPTQLQHVGGGSIWSGRAAVDICTEIPLPKVTYCQMCNLEHGQWHCENTDAKGQHYITLALGRVDLGTVAAAAVLVLRALGLWPPGRGAGDQAPLQAMRDLNATLGCYQRANRIANHATYRPGGWAPRPLPTLEQPWPEKPHTWHEDRELAAVAAICEAPLSDITFTLAPHCRGFAMQPHVRPGLSLANRVAIIACWILWGEPPTPRSGSWGDWAALRSICEACATAADPADLCFQIACARALVEASRRALAEERAREGVIEARWSDGRWCDLTEVPDECGDDEEDGPQLCIVRSSLLDERQARELGFCVAPVVVWLQTRERCSKSECWQHDGERCAVGHMDPGKCPHNAPHVVIAGWAGADGRTRYLDEAQLGERLDILESRVYGERDIVHWVPWSAIGCRFMHDSTRLSEEAIVREVMGCRR